MRPHEQSKRRQQRRNQWTGILRIWRIEDKTRFNISKPNISFFYLSVYCLNQSILTTVCLSTETVKLFRRKSKTCSPSISVKFTVFFQRPDSLPSLKFSLVFFQRPDSIDKSRKNSLRAITSYFLL
jgi:hypothetical protein